jgi:ABC-type uncharacterized transport system auxiliary subunit
MKKPTLPTARLTLVATVAVAVSLAGCGGKSSGTTTSKSTTSTTQKKPSKAPAY